VTYMPSLAFWEEPEEEGAAPRLVRLDDPAAPIDLRPHCKWCEINSSHPNCINNAWMLDDACPDCGYDPEDASAHQGWCPRIGTSGNDGPNWSDPPWAVDEPNDSKYLRDKCSPEHLQKIREQNVADVVLIAMSGHSRLSLPEDAPAGEVTEILGWNRG
jgi:hypothetical protein